MQCNVQRCNAAVLIWFCNTFRAKRSVVITNQSPHIVNDDQTTRAHTKSQQLSRSEWKHFAYFNRHVVCEAYSQEVTLWKMHLSWALLTGRNRFSLVKAVRADDNFPYQTKMVMQWCWYFINVFNLTHTAFNKKAFIWRYTKIIPACYNCICLCLFTIKRTKRKYIQNVV